MGSDDIFTAVQSFEGCYQKRFTGTFPLKDTINLLKVHGPLDVFREAHDVAVSVPMLRELRPGLVPEIITPGCSKFEAILQGTPRQILSAAEEVHRCPYHGISDLTVSLREYIDFYTRKRLHIRETLCEFVNLLRREGFTDCQ